jgi:two-component system phosphate regulon sensor histidine kinase PhoR
VDVRELERKAEVAELLLGAARRLGETMEPERVYGRFHDLLRDVVAHDAVVVSSYDERDGLIRCDYAWVEGNLLDPQIFPPIALNREGGGMQSRVIVSGEPLLANDVEERVQAGTGTYYDVDRQGNVRKLPESGPPGTKAVMMVPVEHERRVVGVVQLMSDRDRYDARDLEIFEGLVAQMAAAVRNARLQRERLRLEAAEAAARAVAAERERAAHVLDVVGDGIFLVDADGTIGLWNRAAAAVTGLDPEGVLGRPAREAVPGWSEIEARVPIADGGSPARSVTLPVEAGGRDLWLSFVGFRDDDGVVYTFRDLTSERRLDEEKSDFIATISHELRTPMAAVYGAARTLLRRDVDFAPEQAQKLLEMIATQSARLTQITEEVLLATRIDGGDLRVEREPVDVVELVRSTVEAMKPQLEPATIEVEVGPAAGEAAGDRDRIEQVLVNLVDNAVKYGDGHRVVVAVDGSTSRVQISVSDTGRGIPPGDLERIFEKFYRGDPNLTRAPGGTGLGLYIARELVERMGGRIEVRSERGAGTTFVVELPRPS